MATKLKVNFSELKKFEDRLNQLQRQELEQFNEKLVRDLAAMELAKLIKRTPKGTYGTKEVEFTTKDGKHVQFTAHSSKQGGTLQQGWKIGRVIKNGSCYEVEIINAVKYASYVENGHRTPDHKGWVEGKFMMKISEQEMEQQGTKIIEKRLSAFLEKVLNGS